MRKFVVLGQQLDLFKLEQPHSEEGSAMFNVTLVHHPLYGRTEVRNTVESMPVLKI